MGIQVGGATGNVSLIGADTWVDVAGAVREGLRLNDGVVVVGDGKEDGTTLGTGVTIGSGVWVGDGMNDPVTMLVLAPVVISGAVGSDVGTIVATLLVDVARGRPPTGMKVA